MSNEQEKAVETTELVPNRIWSVAGIPKRRIVYLRGDHNDFMSNSVRYWDLMRRTACDCSPKTFLAWTRKTGALTHDL